MATLRASRDLTRFVKLKARRPAEARALMLSGTPSTYQDDAAVTFATLPWRAILAGSLIGLAAAMADADDVSGFLARKELKAVNAHFSLRGPCTLDARGVIVTINEDSFVELNMPWPPPRALHAKFPDIVSRGMPAVIALDILFIEPSSRGPADGQAFAQAILRSGKVVLGAGLTEVLESDWIRKLEKILTPLPQIRAGAAA
jgi:adenylate cyclase